MRKTTTQSGRKKAGLLLNVNPYIGIIEKLLKSHDIFNENIEDMMGIINFIYFHSITFHIYIYFHNFFISI